MASLSLRFRCQPTINVKPHRLTFSHLYSSSSSNNDDGNAPIKPSDFSSHFSDIKSKLNQQQQQHKQQPSPNFRPSNFTPQSPSPSTDEIRKNLSEFRRRSADFTPPSKTENVGSPQKPISLQNLYNKNAANPNPNPSSDFLKGRSTGVSLEAIKFSLQRLNPSKGAGNRGTNVKLPQMANVGGNAGGFQSRVIGGSMESLPGGVFGKEIKEREEKKRGEGDESSKFVLLRPYRYDELGARLRELRPDVSKNKKEKEKEKEKEEGGFSLSELQERLSKLKEFEEKQSSTRMSGTAFLDIRRTIAAIQQSQDDSSKRTGIQPFDLLSQPSFKAPPPNEHLVEKYFHPDNMSAAEKLKIELKRVRDEFKMSESDCGSTRVQIAQLTTEISHLSSMLHKKDKHSRRGLQAKVQQRKKLLKYLRRTDWDSYCFVLNKLGLRDNPDYKN